MSFVEIIQNNPRISIILLSLVISLVVTIITHFLTDKKKMKEIRDKQKFLREEMKKYKDNPQKMMELNKQMMEDLPDQLKLSFKPTLVTMIPLLLLFSWLRGVFAITTIASTWIWWYILSSIAFSMIFRKIFDLQ
jgi:uncharacterized membrane protein (DUF106 family)